MLARIKNLGKIEWLLIGIASVVLVSSIILRSTYKEIFFSEKIDPDDVIAKVVSSSKNTRRRSPDSFEFKELEKEDVLANGDSIFSGEGSQLMVKFVNGPRIIIGEQSLIVLREIDGHPDLKIEKGAISGAFTEDDEIEILTEKEGVILNGEKDSQFFVSYMEGGGLEIGSFDRNIKVQHNGKTVNIKNQKAIVHKSVGGMKVKESTGSEGGGDGKVTDSKDAQPPADTQPRMPSGLDVNTPENANRITLNPPYPQQNHVFVHNTGGQIPIYPKLQCQGDCELKLSINGKPGLTKTFRRDMVPFVFLQVKPGIEADVRWDFSDGTHSTSGTFKVRKNNQQNFKDAFQRQFPVEVMN